MKLETSSQIAEKEAVRERTNAFEVLMPRPRTSSSPKKLESPRLPPEDENLKKIAKENRASNKKNLEEMSQSKSEKRLNARNSVLNKKMKKPTIVMLDSDSEDEQSGEVVSSAKEHPVKRVVNTTRRKILSESESDAHESPKKNQPKAELPLQLLQCKLKFKPQTNADKEGDTTKKRNSLLNYFNSVSREEAKKTAEQIKVTPLLHSPPATPGRKPINKKSPIDSPRRSARMRLCYETCDQIEVISSEVISVPNTPVKTPVKETVVPKAETPKRASKRTPRKSPETKKEKPDYIKNLKLKIRAPIKLKDKTGASAEKFILSPEALDELFLSPELKKQTKKKKPCVVLDSNETIKNKASRRISKTSGMSPKKTSTTAITPRKINITPKNSPRTKTSGSTSKRTSPRNINVTLNDSPSSKTVSEMKKNTSISKDARMKTPRRETAASKSLSRNKIDSPTRLAIVPQNKSLSLKSSKEIKEKSLAQVVPPSKSTTPKKLVSGTGRALSSERSAFEEIMSKKRREISSDNYSSAEIHKKKNSKSSTLAKKESLKSDKVEVSNSSAGKMSATKQESQVASPLTSVRKSKRILSSDTRKPKQEEIKETKNLRQKKRKRIISSDEEDDDDDDVILIETKSKKQHSNSAKPPLKMAPMFMKRTSKLPGKVEDPAITEAKRRFLSSGVPECIKKIAEIHSQPEQEVSIFPTIAHVKQEEETPGWTLSDKRLELLPDDVTSFDVEIATMDSGTFMDPKAAVISELREPNLPRQIESYRKVLNNLKLENPNYCVIRNYKRLKSKFEKSLTPVVVEKIVEAKATRQKRTKKRKRSEVEVIEEIVVAVPQEPALVWTEKYKPTSGEDVVGNASVVQQLKTWLESWKRFYKSDDPNYDIIKGKRSKSGSSDEFIEDDASEEEDNSQMPINTSLIFGPCGSGKTSAVYAIAHELGYKVLEINASSKRTGKHLQKLQEATQSHRVCAKTDAHENIAKMFAQSAKQKKKKTVVKDKPKSSDGDDANNKMSLILIENADIIFEDEDEGFIAALISLVQSSKRPVVMVANDSFCPHLARFFEQGLVIEMDSPHLSHLCAWLQLVCLVEGVRIGADAVQRLVGRFDGDVARCLTQLHFWVLTGGNNLERCHFAPNSMSKDDDDSNLTATTERVDEGTPLHDKCIELFLGNSSQDLIPYPIRLTEVWWNLAPILSLPQPVCRRIAVEPYIKPRNAAERLNELFSELDGDVEEENIFDRLKRKNRTVDTDVIAEEEVIKPAEPKPVAKKWASVCSQEEMDRLAMLADNLAAADELTSHPRTNGDVFDVGPCPRVWQRKPTDGISVRNDDGLCWYREQTVAQSMAHLLVERSVRICRDASGKIGGEYNVALPKQEDVRWLAEQQEADNTIVSLVPTNALIDHRSTFSDYLPMLQSVCRHENTRLSVNTKRRNRFFHYLRGLGCHPSEQAVNVLCSTFDNGLWRCDAEIQSDSAE